MYSAAVMAPWTMAGFRYVATGPLKDLRYPDDGPFGVPSIKGSFLACYWIQQGRLDEQQQWVAGGDGRPRRRSHADVHPPRRHHGHVLRLPRRVVARRRRRPGRAGARPALPGPGVDRPRAHPRHAARRPRALAARRPHPQRHRGHAHRHGAGVHAAAQGVVVAGRRAGGPRRGRPRDAVPLPRRGPPQGVGPVRRPRQVDRRVRARRARSWWRRSSPPCPAPTSTATSSGRRARYPPSTSLAVCSTAVPSKKSGFMPPCRRTALSNVKSRKSVAVNSPSSTSS